MPLSTPESSFIRGYDDAVRDPNLDSSRFDTRGEKQNATATAATTTIAAQRKGFAVLMDWDFLFNL